MYGLKRDPKYISSLIEMKGESIYCKERCIIEYPSYYNDKGMADESEEVQLYGIFAIIVGDKYSVSTIPTICVSEPIDISEVERDGVKYRQLRFGKGDPIIKSRKVLTISLKAYNFIESFFMRSNIPWYIEYLDLVKCMDNLVKYADSGVGDNMLANELMTSFVSRSPKDKNIFYRQVGSVGEIEYVDIMNLYYSVKSTTNRLAGGYMNNSITSALVNPSTRDTKLDLHMKG